MVAGRVRHQLSKSSSMNQTEPRPTSFNAFSGMRIPIASSSSRPNSWSRPADTSRSNASTSYAPQKSVLQAPRSFGRASGREQGASTAPSDMTTPSLCSDNEQDHEVDHHAEVITPPVSQAEEPTISARAAGKRKMVDRDEHDELAARKEARFPRLGESEEKDDADASDKEEAEENGERPYLDHDQDDSDDTSYGNVSITSFLHPPMRPMRHPAQSVSPSTEPRKTSTSLPKPPPLSKSVSHRTSPLFSSRIPSSPLAAEDAAIMSTRPKPPSRASKPRSQLTQSMTRVPALAMHQDNRHPYNTRDEMAAQTQPSADGNPDDPFLQTTTQQLPKIAKNRPRQSKPKPTSKLSQTSDAKLPPLSQSMRQIASQPVPPPRPLSKSVSMMPPPAATQESKKSLRRRDNSSLTLEEEIRRARGAGDNYDFETRLMDEMELSLDNGLMDQMDMTLTMGGGDQGGILDDFDHGVFVGVGSKSKNRGFMSGGGAGGRPIVADIGYHSDEDNMTTPTAVRTKLR